jgi:hypothetical protein
VLLLCIDEMADGLMLVRYFLKKELERNSSTPISEASLSNYTSLYWQRLSKEDRKKVQQVAQRNYYFDAISSDPPRTQMNISCKVLPIPQKSQEEEQRLLAYLLSQEFPILSSESQTSSSLPTESQSSPSVPQQISIERYSQQGSQLRRFSELSSVSDLQASLESYRVRNEIRKQHAREIQSKARDVTRKRRARELLFPVSNQLGDTDEKKGRNLKSKR